MTIPEEKKQKFRDWWAHKGTIVGGWTGVFKDRSLNLRALIGNKNFWEGQINRYLRPEESALLDPFVLDMQEFPAETLRVGNFVIGPGSLALYLGSEPLASEHTIWFTKAFNSREDFPERLAFDPVNFWWLRTERVMDESLKTAAGQYLLGFPDLVENLDILASLRGTNDLLLDLVDAPDWVEQRLREINQVYFEVYDRMYERIRDSDGGSVYSAYSLWAPGKVAKVQCDNSACISPAMFNRFVLPSLTEQVEYLDYSLYHLDGTTCLQHLDTLLSIEKLQAIEWTPQAGLESGTDPRWWPLYRKILEAGKSVQILVSRADGVEPLLKEIGTDGVYLLNEGPTSDVYRMMDVVARLTS